jgi:hypothetical protein
MVVEIAVVEVAVEVRSIGGDGDIYDEGPGSELLTARI